MPLSTFAAKSSRLGVMMDPPNSGSKMEARSTDSFGVLLPHSVEPPQSVEVLAEDPFFYGYRWVEVRGAQGTDHVQVPLTEEDLLDPQEGDCVSEHTLHHWAVRKICEMLEQLFTSRGKTKVLVSGNLKMLWKDPKVKRVDPDVVVIPDVENPHVDRKSFEEKKEGTRPVFALEVTSEATENTDTNKKPGVYQAAGVREYFILESLLIPWTLVGRRLNPQTGRYRKIRPDREGRIASETLEVLFAIGPEGSSVVLTDTRTGERLRNLAESEEARQAEAEARQAEAEARRAAEKALQAVEAENQRLKALLEERS